MLGKNYYSFVKRSSYNKKLSVILKKEIQQGLAFYKQFLNKRLENAIQYFSPAMKSAVYEILFLLHYNHPSLQVLRLKSPVKPKLEQQTDKKVLTYDLYLGGVPSGVLGFNNLSRLFLEDMRSHINKEFQIDITKLSAPSFCPIVSVASLGSIGTIAHKLEKSDLDLQIQYDLNPYLLRDSNCNDRFFNSIFTLVFEWHKKIIHRSKINNGLLDKMFPTLLSVGSFNYESKELNQHLRLASELANLYDVYEGRVLYSDKIKLEKALQTRIKNIESYIQNKYPEEEVHFFAYSTDNYRKGQHGTTLESKESSGSAYEKILTYETLMPGIHYNPVIPSHFLFGNSVNDNNVLYNSIISCIRLRLFDSFFVEEIGVDPKRIVNLGNSPHLSDRYLDEHRGAVYWEAFKGSSGNLPKSFLNLLRLETLYQREDGGNKSVIQLIKEPTTYRKLLSEIKAKADKENQQDPYGLNYDEKDPFALQEIYRIEVQSPELLYDPWWIRYKVLKIFYHNVISLDYQTRMDISFMIDVCFALHVGLDDIFLSQYAKLNDLETNRIRVLNDYFENAFPALTVKRMFIEQIFQGEISSVNYFEKKLKKHFKESIDRILSKDSNALITAKAEEKKIWLRYYEQNFEPKKNQIPTNILSGIHRLRGRLQISFNENNWYFKIVPSVRGQEGRFRVFGTMSSGPQKVSFHVDDDLVKGLVYCVINKFYGVHYKQAIKTSSSLIEFNSRSFVGKSPHDLKQAKMTAELLEIMATGISARFPKISVDYRQAMSTKFQIREVIFLINVLVFGRVQAVYRDLMENYYVINFDDADLNAKPYDYFGDLNKFLSEERLLNFIAKCLKKMPMGGLSADTLLNRVSYWLNPLSINSESSIRKDQLNNFSKSVNYRLSSKLAPLLGIDLGKQNEKLVNPT